ncbi:hypothetical protein RF11_02628 [Thelohanellus kitauei]|uniref:Uncharacterized protein n=1 Tax=Thelohanellus kitauei TaxID=669202 RepID=A0A0C2INC1_THEKT|nr:hypothetical protein RF11_02628 [Thelohanellus kitauei]
MKLNHLCLKILEQCLEVRLKEKFFDKTYQYESILMFRTLLYNYVEVVLQHSEDIGWNLMEKSKKFFLMENVGEFNSLKDKPDLICSICRIWNYGIDQLKYSLVN